MINQEEKNIDIKTNNSGPKPVVENTIKDKKESKLLIYLGPHIPNVTAKNAVYKNGLPKALEEYAKANPLVNKFVVNIDNLLEVKTKLADKTSAYSNLYRELEQKIKGAK